MCQFFHARAHVFTQTLRAQKHTRQTEPAAAVAGAVVRATYSENFVPNSIPRYMRVIDQQPKANDAGSYVYS